MKDRLASLLLKAGLCAGPVVLSVGFTAALTREGFSLHRNASSQLALGEWGWVQSINFVVAGLLMLAFAIGARRVLRGQVGALWAPLLLGVFAVSHVMVGVFATDPVFGYPPGPGTPIGAPDMDTASLSAKLHSFFGFLGFNALAIASFVLARHFGTRRPLWLASSLGVGFAILAIGAYAAHWESQHQGAARATASFDFLPMWFLLPLVWSYITALAWHLWQQHRSAQ